MGWNTCAIFVEASREVVLDAIASLCSPTEREIDFSEASLMELEPELAAAELDGWTEVWDPGGQLARSTAQEALRRSLSRKRRVLAVVWSSVTSQYGFRFYENDALVRAVLYENGEIASEEGDMLPEEDNIEIPSWGPDEDWAFTIIEKLTAIDHASRDRASYLVLEP